MRVHRLLFLLALIAGSSGAVVRAGQAVDISGTWSFSVDMGSTQGMPTFVFKQQGERLTGTATQGRGERKVSGMVKGNKAIFGFEADRGGGPFKATYRGTIESATKMSGTVDFTGALSGSGTWTANKK